MYFLIRVAKLSKLNVEKGRGDLYSIKQVKIRKAQIVRIVELVI